MSSIMQFPELLRRYDHAAHVAEVIEKVIHRETGRYIAVKPIGSQGLELVWYQDCFRLDVWTWQFLESEGPQIKKEFWNDSFDCLRVLFEWKRGCVWEVNSTNIEEHGPFVGLASKPWDLCRFMVHLVENAKPIEEGDGPGIFKLNFAPRLSKEQEIKNYIKKTTFNWKKKR